MYSPILNAWITENQPKALDRSWTQSDYFSRLFAMEQECRDRAMAREVKGLPPELSFKHSAATALQSRAIQLRLKAGDGDSGTFTFFACRYGNIDRQGDVIEPGAVKNTDEFLMDGVILLGHIMTDLPVASAIAAASDSKGLKITARWYSTQAAQECRSVVQVRMRLGKNVSCSIGYLVPADGGHFEKRNGQNVRVLSSINIYAVSLVNIPANPVATVIEA